MPPSLSSPNEAQSSPSMATMNESLYLPPGFRFHPTDEEIITHYLCPKLLHQGFTATAMGDVDLNKCEPWDLPSKAKMGENEWYFFCLKDRKYPTGMRTNRATESGYWKATGKDKEIYRGKGVVIGMKKTLVFYIGRAPKGEKTNWVLHEYRVEGKITLCNLPKSSKDEWVVCRVFHKSLGLKKSSLVRMNSFRDELPDLPPLPPLMDHTHGAGADSGFDLKTILDDSDWLSSSSLDVHGRIRPAIQKTMTIRPLPASRMHCTAEQISNQSMISQETGVSTDRNGDVLSCASYGGFNLPTAAASGGGLLELGDMWRW